MSSPFASLGTGTSALAVAGSAGLAVVFAILALVGVAGWAWQWRRRRSAEAAAEQRVRETNTLIERAEALLWEAEVELTKDDWTWVFTLHKSALAARIMDESMPSTRRRLWTDRYEVPEQAAMGARARAAIEQGLPGYEQEFRLVRGNVTFWMHERVSISPRGPNRFWLVGLVTDRTAVHEAEIAQRRSELTVDSIMAHAEWMLWRATVVQQDGKLHWIHFDIPKSRLSQLLFGDRVYSRDKGFWENMRIPEQAEMDARSSRAILGGAAGYEQQFEVFNRDGRKFLLHERVTISRVDGSRWTLVGMIADVTVQHEIESARRASEARLAYLLERADCLVWEATVTLRPDDTLHWHLYTQRSMLYRKIFGERNDTELNWHTVRVPEFDEMAGRALDAIKSRSRGYTQEFHVERPEGAIWLREVVTMVEEKPSVFSLVGVITDITAQRRAEEAQRRSELRLSALLARADCMVWQGDARRTPNGDMDWRLFTPKSHLFHRLFGCDPDPDAHLQFTWTKKHVPEADEMNRRAEQAMARGSGGYEQVFRYLSGGREIWLNEKVTIKPLGADHWELIGIITDITPQRGAEVALAAEKERLSVTLRAMSESVITTDVNGVVQFMNPAAAALTGWKEKEAFGHEVSEICHLADSRTDQAVALPVQRVARGDIVADLPPQTQLLTRAHQRRLVEGCCAPIHAMDSKVIGTVLVFRDVTEHERLEQELVRATRLESVGVLAGGIAHDFNNILTAIMGNLTLAQLDVPPESPAAGTLRSAEKAALRARDLTQQLLTFAKGGEPVRTAVQLDAIVREMTSFALHGSQVKASFDFGPDLWPADADKGQIGRVVQNIVINAAQAMPRGGMLRIAVRNESLDSGAVPGLPPGNYIQIAISDSGEGIRPEHLERIFDPYFTTKQTGTGLGLAAVYSIVKKHSGHIDVESQIGQGTTFRIWLPALRGESAGSDSRPPWTPNRLQGRVLFMDDEKIIRDLASTLLTRFGLDVECAADGAEAIALYCKARDGGRPFDVVIMDLTIPGGMGGLAAIGELRAIDPRVKAIVSSGYSSDPVMANYRAHGFVAMIAKPYEVDEFAKVLREVLGVSP